MGIYRQPPQPHQGLRSVIPAEVVAADNPPFGIPVPALWQILSLWQPGPPQPWPGWRTNPSLTAVPEDNPPFGIPLPSLWTILSAWHPGPLVPLLGGRFLPLDGGILALAESFQSGTQAIAMIDE